MDAIELLLTRRSTSVKHLAEPAPTAEELEIILRAATRVPDHGKLTPWRIVVLNDPQKLGDIAAALFAHQYPDADEKQLAHERHLFTRAPLVLAVIFTPKVNFKAPEWEQMLSVGAVCMNILHACHALGYGAKWLSEWVAYRSEILTALGGGEGDKIAGFIYIGSKTEEPEDRERPELSAVVSEY